MAAVEAEGTEETEVIEVEEGEASGETCFSLPFDSSGLILLMKAKPDKVSTRCRMVL